MWLRVISWIVFGPIEEGAKEKKTLMNVSDLETILPRSPR